jgi:GNAT superfamily N-acetyltransferase
MNPTLTIRDLRADEADALGGLLVGAYATLDGFPRPDEQPAYYAMLRDIGRFMHPPATRVLVAKTDDGRLAGGVVYVQDMAAYGSGGTATQLHDSAGLRLLGVEPSLRGAGVGKALTRACIALALEHGRREIVLHTTRPMQVAWGMYERLGFVRSPELDFDQGRLPVFGFRLALAPGGGASAA